jgi:hypothetical protein
VVDYADTSFLISLYGRDANSRPAQALASELDVPLAFPSLLRHEVRNAVRLAVFRHEISTEEAGAILSALADDVRTGVLVETPLPWADVFAEAEALGAAHTPGLGTRALDILHVAAARVLGARRFLTFDSRQKALAKKAGLKVRA